MTAKTKAELEKELALVAKELEEFKSAVRERIIEAVRNEEICQGGAASALEDFGLEGIKDTYTFTVQLSLDIEDVYASAVSEYHTANTGFGPSDEEFEELLDALCAHVSEFVVPSKFVSPGSSSQVSCVDADGVQIFAVSRHQNLG